MESESEMKSGEPNLPIWNGLVSAVAKGVVCIFFIFNAINWAN